MFKFNSIPAYTNDDYLDLLKIEVELEQARSDISDALSQTYNRAERALLMEEGLKVSLGLGLIKGLKGD